MLILWCMDSKLCVKFQKFEISHKIVNPYTAKYVFYEVFKVGRIVIS